MSFCTCGDVQRCRVKANLPHKIRSTKMNPFYKSQNFAFVCDGHEAYWGDHIWKHSCIQTNKLWQVRGRVWKEKRGCWCTWWSSNSIESFWNYYLHQTQCSKIITFIKVILVSCSLSSKSWSKSWATETFDISPNLAIINFYIRNGPILRTFYDLVLAPCIQKDH